MILLMMSALMSLMIPMAVLVIVAMISKKMMNDREKSSPFECGFDPKSSARMPFSIFSNCGNLLNFWRSNCFNSTNYYYHKHLTNNYMNNNNNIFIIVLLVGLYHEWTQGALKWAE